MRLFFLLLLVFHVVREWRDSSAVEALAWSPDGQRLASASDFGRTLSIWSASG
jgi:WD40 repeat protein